MRTTQQQRQGDSQELATLTAQIRASTCWDWAEYFIPALLARVDAPTLPAGRDQPTTGVVPLPTGLPADTVQDHPFLPLASSPVLPGVLPRDLHPSTHRQPPSMLQRGPQASAASRQSYLRHDAAFRGHADAVSSGP